MVQILEGVLEQSRLLSGSSWVNCFSPRLAQTPSAAVPAFSRRSTILTTDDLPSHSQGRQALKLRSAWGEKQEADGEKKEKEVMRSVHLNHTDGKVTKSEKRRSIWGRICKDDFGVRSRRRAPTAEAATRQRASCPPLRGTFSGGAGWGSCSDGGVDDGASGSPESEVELSAGHDSPGNATNYKEGLLGRPRARSLPPSLTASPLKGTFGGTHERDRWNAKRWGTTAVTKEGGWHNGSGLGNRHDYEGDIASCSWMDGGVTIGGRERRPQEEDLLGEYHRRRGGTPPWSCVGGC